MRTDLLILQICDFLDDGDGHYRLHEPSRQLARLPGVAVIDCHFYHRLLPGLAEAADVVVLPFVHNEDFFPAIERRRAAGRVTVFEANDYFYDVQPWNTVGPAWQDRAVREEYRQFMRVADAVQTSTAELGRRWGPWARRVAVFPNQLAEVPPLGEPPPRPLTVGWGGSPGHFADWYHVAPVLKRWLDTRPGVRLAVMTNEFARPFVQLPPERYQFTPFGPLAAYLRFLETLDIGLAPLLPSEYNRCRSDVKYLEYASRGVAGLYADLEPYRESVIAEETGLVYRDLGEFVRQLDRLADDAALRQRLRRQAYARVAEGRRIEDHIGERLEFYRGLLPGPARGMMLPAEVLAAAEADGRYLRLRPQAPEQALLAAIQGPATPDKARSLVEVIAGHPTYTAALQHLGRLWNDLRETARARPVLERALALDRTSARTLGELGRAHFLVGDRAGARRWLGEAVTINPHATGAWQYLLRLEELDRRPEGRAWAVKVREAHPDNFRLALAAARTFTGAEAVAALADWLARFGDGLAPEERPGAVAAYGQAAAEAVARAGAGPEAVALLAASCRAFPESARLANANGWALHATGDEEASVAEYARAMALERQARLFAQEYPDPAGMRTAWLIAEHIRRWAGPAPPSR